MDDSKRKWYRKKWYLGGLILSTIIFGLIHFYIGAIGYIIFGALIAYDYKNDTSE